MPQRISSPFGTVIIDEDSPGSLFQTLLGEGDKKTHRHEPVSMTPEVDIYEDDKQFTVWMDLPGVDKESIQVSVSGHRLSVNAETRKINREGGHWIRHERRVGAYVRTLQLGQAVNEETISANYADGTLILTLAKKEPVKSKTIEVNIE